VWHERALVAALVLAGCSAEPEREAGQRGDTQRVAVPRDDPSPPMATIVLRAANGRRFAEASQPPGARAGETAKLREPILQATAIARDSNGGVARVRVSLKELITCRTRGGIGFKRRRTRYFPPPQIERIRSSPGASLLTETSRTLSLRLGRGRCGRGQTVAVAGELWGEAINGSGLEAVTPHVRFRWARELATAPSNGRRSGL
jgi:hypothetical protein